MSETLLTFVVVFAGLGCVLFLVALGGGVYFLVRSKKESDTTNYLISFIKNMATSNRKNITGKLKEKFSENSKVNIDTLVECERQLYRHLIKFSIYKDTSLLKSTTFDIHSLVDNYMELLAGTSEINSNDNDNEGESKTLVLKKENKALRIEIASMENRLQIALETIENMLGEFSSMYEGGKKEGEQKVKNEMYKLKQQQDIEEAKFKEDIKKIEE